MSPTESKPQSPSTGPRTAEGKSKSAMNAMRHGLTGRVVVLPTEDMSAWHAFCKELMADLAPETALERQYAQTFCDTQWRLNRARSYEDSMLALAHFEGASVPGVEHPEIHNALVAAKVFRENSKAFVNLSLYEQRLARQQKEALRQLQELQAQRKAAAKAEAAVKEATPSANKTNAEPAQPFVFSTPETAREPQRHTGRAEDQNPRSRTESALEQAA
jgi:hypothetical protein